MCLWSEVSLGSSFSSATFLSWTVLIWCLLSSQWNFKKSHLRVGKREWGVELITEKACEIVISGSKESKLTKAGVRKLWSMGQIWPLTVFMNIFFSGHRAAQFFSHIVYDCFIITKLTISNGVIMVHKPYNTYYLELEKWLPTPGLEICTRIT